MKSIQFSNPTLVAAYDAINALGSSREFWLRTIARLSPSTIVDLGCGTGLLTCDLARHGYNIVGIEPAGGMLEMAGQKPGAAKVRWIHGGYEKLRELQADLILMTSHVAQFFVNDHEWQAMLQAASAALHPGGHLLFDSRTPIFPPFQSWPTETSPIKIKDPRYGSIEWYHELISQVGNRVRYDLHFHFTESRERIVSREELVFRTRQELTQSLNDAGFAVTANYGDWYGNPLADTASEMIFLCTSRT